MVKNKTNKVKSFLLKKENIFLFTLCLAAIFLRILNLSYSLFFGPEQGIDFLRIKEVVVGHNLLLVGAKTDISGIFHGPIYYYIATIPFFLSHGDPAFIASFLIILNCLTVFFIYITGKDLFNKRVGFIAAVLFTISFGAISYSHWLSSHPLVIPISSLFLIGIFRFIQGKKYYLLLVSVSYALLGQAEFLNYLFFGGIVIVTIFVFFKSFKEQSQLFLFLSACLVFIFGFLHYVIFDLKNNFLITLSVIGLLHGNGYYVSYPNVIRQVYDSWGETLSRDILPFAPSLIIYILLLGALAVLWRSKYKIAKRLIFIHIFIPIILLIFLKHSVLQQFFVYSMVITLVLTAFFADYLLKKKRVVGILFLTVLIAVQLSAWCMYEPDNRYMFFASTQPDLHLGDEKKVIDDIYTMQKGANFSFQSYTIPSWSQQAWDYLFWQYGKRKYGYLPIKENGKTLYVIIQDDPSNLRFQKNWILKTVSHWGVYKKSFRQGIFTVQILDIPWVH